MLLKNKLTEQKGMSKENFQRQELINKFKYKNIVYILLYFTIEIKQEIIKIF